MSDAGTLAEVLDVVGIDTVVWIDDKFDAVERAAGPVQMPALAEMLARLHASRVAPNHQRLRELDPQAEFDEWRDVSSELEGEAPEVLADIASTLQLQLDAIEVANARDRKAGESSAGPADGEYTSADLEAILKSFKGRVEKLGFAQWKASRVQIKARLSARTLVVVDRELRVDGRPVAEGDAILGELVSEDGAASVVMLTHSVPEQGTEQLRTELALKLSVSPYKFAVMAKAGGGEFAEASLRRSIREVFTHQTCLDLFQQVEAAMKSGLAIVKGALARQSIYDLDLVMFEKSLDEGALEIEVIARLALLRQRVAVDEMLATTHSGYERLQALRELRRIADLAQEPPRARMSALQLMPEWRVDEVFDPAKRINGRHAPLACGDVFQSGTSKKNVWVLLGQPCDIAVRSDGRRKGKEAFFVKAKEVSTAAKPTSQEGTPAPVQGAKDEAPSQRFFNIPGMLGQKEWRLDFTEWASVSLDCLDLAVFNSDGALRVSLDSVAPTPLLPGWRKRYDRAVTAMKNAEKGKAPKCLSALSISDVVGSREPKMNNGKELWFDYKRVGRIRLPRSVAAYAAFASFHSRAAFEHNFAELLTQATVAAPDTAEPPMAANARAAVPTPAEAVADAEHRKG